MALFLVVDDFETQGTRLTAGSVVDDQHLNVAGLLASGLVVVPIVAGGNLDAARIAYLDQRKSRPANLPVPDLAALLGARGLMSVAYTLLFGGNGGNLFFRVSAPANDNMSGSQSAITDAGVSFASKLRIFGWNADLADATTVFNVVVNTVVVTSLTLTGNAGVLPLDIDVAESDEVAVSFTAGTAPSNTIVTITGTGFLD